MLRITLLLLCIVLSACSAGPVTMPTPAPAATPTRPATSECSPPASWTIEYHRTGGIAGFDQMLTLQSDGSLAIQSKKPALDKQIMVPSDHIETIAGLLAQACPFNAVRTSGVCADCYTYELNIEMDGQSYSLQASDVSLTEEQRPLVETLDQFLKVTGQ